MEELDLNVQSPSGKSENQAKGKALSFAERFANV